MSQGTNPPSIPTIAQDEIVGATSSVKGVLADFLAPILPNIGKEPAREELIKIHQLISGNAAFVASNLKGGGHRHLALTMTADEYI